jgi:hypothetical protein
MLNHDAKPDDSANLTQSIQIPGTSLAVVAPVIDPFDGIVILEDLLRIDEVDAMFGEIGGRLLCVPFEPIGHTTVNPYLSIEQGFNAGARSDKPGRMCDHG